MVLAILLAIHSSQAAPIQQGESDFAREVYENIRRELPPPPDDAAIILPVDPRHAPPRRTAAWLAGSWVNSKAQCYGGDFGVGFGADGRFSDYWFSGRYRIVGSRIHQQVTELTDAAEPDDRVGQRFSRKLRLVGPNELVIGEGADAERLFRCPEGGLKD